LNSSDPESLHSHYLIPVIPKTWQETWQDF